MSGDLSRDETAAAILGAFRGSIERRRTTWRYRFGVVGAALAALPLIAIYAAALFGAFAMIWLPPRDAGGAWFFRVIGVGLALVLARPLLRYFLPTVRRVAVTRAEEPLLFAFVDRVCEAVHAPRPTEIVFDVAANAGVKFRRGLLSLPWNDLTLSIGLPLVRGMTLTQLASVFAHEFGHLSQKTGMRLGWFAYIVNDWFIHAIDDPQTPVGLYRRWWARGIERIVRVVLTVGTLLGWIALARMFFALLARMSWSAYSYLSRQMEYDADRCASRLIGGAEAAAALDRVHLLAFVDDAATGALEARHREGALPDDVAAWTVGHLEKLTPEEIKAIVDGADQGRAEWLDTHPGHAKRRAELCAETTPGVFSFEGPATLLFSDLDSIARRATREFYKAVLGPDLDRVALEPTADSLRRKREAVDDSRARARFWVSPSLMLRPPELFDAEAEARSQGVDVATLLGWARADAERLAPQYAKAAVEVATAGGRVDDLLFAETAALAAVAFPHQQLGLRRGTRAEIREALAAAREEEARQLALMEPFETASRRRLFAALALVGPAEPPDDDASSDAGELVATAVGEDPRTESERLIKIYRRLLDSRPTVLRLRAAWLRLAMLVPLNEQWQIGWSYWSVRWSARRELRLTLEAVLEDFGETPHPFLRGPRPTTIARHFVEPRFGEIPQHGRFEIAHRVLDKYETLVERVLGRLASLAEGAEKSRGLEPLEGPQFPTEEAPATGESTSASEPATPGDEPTADAAPGGESASPPEPSPAGESTPKAGEPSTP